MRTREEQIAELRRDLRSGKTDLVNWESDERFCIAETHILEAERRAEQRVRAEIGRDSERLDWLSSMKIGVDYRENFGWGVYDILEGLLGESETIRGAIDASREAAK